MPPALWDSLVFAERTELPDLRDQLDLLVLLAHPVSQDPLVHPDLLVRLAHPEQKELTVAMESMVHQVTQAPRVAQATQEREDFPVCQDWRASVVQPEAKAHPVLLALKENPEHQEPQVWQDVPAFQVPPAKMVLVEPLVNAELLEPKETQDNKDPQDQLDHEVQQAPLDSPVVQVKLVLRVTTA